jgi:hypothetical protein
VRDCLARPGSEGCGLHWGCLKIGVKMHAVLFLLPPRTRGQGGVKCYSTLPAREREGAGVVRVEELC